MRALILVISLALSPVILGQNIAKINGIPLDNVAMVDSIPLEAAQRIWSGTANLIAGWWMIPGENCAMAWQGDGASTYEQSLIDLTGAGNNLITGNAPTWQANWGWGFDATSNYLITPINVNNYQSGFTIIISFDFVTDDGNYKDIIGADVSSSIYYRGFSLSPYPPTQRAYAYIYDDFLEPGSYTSFMDGTIGLTFDGSRWTLYKNGTSLGSFLKANEGMNGNLYLGAFFDYVSETVKFTRIDDSFYVGALAVYSTCLDSTQMATLHTNIPKP